MLCTYILYNKFGGKKYQTHVPFIYIKVRQTHPIELIKLLTLEKSYLFKSN